MLSRGIWKKLDEDSVYILQLYLNDILVVWKYLMEGEVSYWRPTI